MNASETIAPSSTWIPSQNAVSCEIEGEIVLLDLQSGSYFGLNGIAAEIWNQLVLQKCVGEIQQGLMSRYAVSEQQCEREVLALIGHLRESGLVRSRDDEAGR